MFEAILLNPSPRARGRRRRARKGARKGNAMRRKRVRRSRSGRFVKRVRRVRYSRRRHARKVRRVRHVRRARRANPRNPWIKRYRRKRYVARHYRHMPRRHNPVSLGGRRGKFDLIPSMKSLQEAAYLGGGAVASEMVRATAYSLIGRVSGSVAEDVLGRLASGAVTGMLAGYLLGQKFASAVVTGTYTVTMFQLISDAVALATGGAPKIAGVIANPFTSVPTKPLLPGFSLGGGVAPAEGVAGLFGTVPERNILPLGGVVPEGDIAPLGDDQIPARLRSRF